MKIALLLCDRVREEFLDISGDYPEMFSRLFPQLQFEIFDLCNGHFPGSARAFDGYLVTGSRYSVYDEMDWIVRLKSFTAEIQAAGKYFVGICFGHQMLAEALGGKVQSSGNGWCVGVHQFKPVVQEHWMQPALSNFNLLMSCQDQVIEMPVNSRLLVTSDACPVAGFRVGTRMLGLQAHPEFSKGYSAALIRDRRTKIGIEKAGQAIKSLEQPLHAEWVAQHVLRFLGVI